MVVSSVRRVEKMGGGPKTSPGRVVLRLGTRVDHFGDRGGVNWVVSQTPTGGAVVVAARA